MGAMFCLMQKRHSDEAKGLPNNSCYDAEFADDSLLGGSDTDVLDRFKAELACAPRYDLNFEVGECVVYCLAGEDFEGSTQGFEAIGVRVCRVPNIGMLKAKISGDEAFRKEWCDKTCAKLGKAVDAIVDLPNSHTAFHLLRHCASACKINHLVRCMPKALLEPVLDDFDKRQRVAFERISAWTLTDDQWIQAQMPALRKKPTNTDHASSGLGLKNSRLTASAAYLASRKMTRDDCARLYPGMANDDQHLMAAKTEMSQYVSPEAVSAVMSESINITQRTLTARIETYQWDQLFQRSASADRARLLAYSAPWSDGWMGVTPSECLDTQMSNRTFHDTVGLRLGVDAFQESFHCPFCRSVMDTRGHHCAACMAGGPMCCSIMKLGTQFIAKQLNRTSDPNWKRVACSQTWVGLALLGGGQPTH